jgi:hypothetical protein
MLTHDRVCAAQHHSTSETQTGLAQLPSIQSAGIPWQHDTLGNHHVFGAGRDRRQTLSAATYHILRHGHNCHAGGPAPLIVLGFVITQVGAGFIE